MAEQLPDGNDEGHPVLTGLVALVGVGLVVGLILGLVVLAGTKVLGVGGDDNTASAGDQQTLYVPKPKPTPTPTGPEITLSPGETASSEPGGGEGTGTGKPHASESPDKQISLSSSTTSAGPMEQFNLTGVYPGGEGAILQVQRFTDGSWQDFPVTVPVSGEQFAAPVQTSQAGANRFRVVDTDSDLKSNEVTVTIN